VLLLLVAGFVAGVATFLSPCVLPVLPVVLAGGLGGGRRGPIGIAAGLAVSFTVFTLTASRLLSALGLPQDLLHTLAIWLIALLGVALLFPRIAELLGRPLAPLGARAGGGLRRREGFWGGALLGAGLGLVWAPCAGPILAAITVLAAQDRVSFELVGITLAYAAGAALPLLGLALLGQRAVDRLGWLRRHGGSLRRAMGAVLVLAAVLFTTSVPDRLAVAAPSYTAGLGRLERSGSVRSALNDLTRHGKPAPFAAPGAGLKDYGRAPDFAGITTWINSKPLTLARLRGRVVLIDFWTYSCINCLRTLPYLKAWDARYRSKGLTIVGVHTPEFAFEHVVSNVRRAVAEHGIRYPVAVDDDYATWNAWNNEYWPAEFLIDQQGRVREAHFGEGQYDQTEADIRSLLSQRGAMARPKDVVSPSADVATPETYLGHERAAGYRQGIAKDAAATYRLPSSLSQNQVGLGGTWTVRGQRIVAGRGAELQLSFRARRAYLVAAPPAGRSATIGVSVDGKAASPIHVGDDDLYQVADDDGPSHWRVLTLRPTPGAMLYSFTFG
jgi:cytochrome c biogenesis protein CcdA/thiol-disulfide isomerase/thioredoxin